MIDIQQQYINLNIRGEISIIVVQAHNTIQYNTHIFISGRTINEEFNTMIID